MVALSADVTITSTVDPDMILIEVGETVNEVFGTVQGTSSVFERGLSHPPDVVETESTPPA